MRIDKETGRNYQESLVQWFVECDPFGNESLARALAEQGIGDAENKHVGMLGSDGKEHDVWQVPAGFVTRLRQAKRGDGRFAFRFFVRNGPEGPIRPADFLEKKASSRKHYAARQRLTELRRRKGR
jgi:hypothetical protein